MKVLESKTVLGALITGTLGLVGVALLIYFQQPANSYSGTVDIVGDDKVEGDQVMGIKIVNSEATSSLAPTLRQIQENIAQANQIANAAMYASINQSHNERSCSSEGMINRLPVSVYDLNDAYFHSFLAAEEEKENFGDRTSLVVVERGLVHSRNASSDGTPYLTLKQNRSDYFTIDCYFDAGWAKAVAALKEGQEIRFCGRIADFLGGVRLSECELLE